MEDNSQSDRERAAYTHFVGNPQLFEFEDNRPGETALSHFSVDGARESPGMGVVKGTWHNIAPEEQFWIDRQLGANSTSSDGASEELVMDESLEEPQIEIRLGLSNGGIHRGKARARREPTAR